MVQFDTSIEPPAMETCVLIPEDFSLKIEASPKLESSASPYASFLGTLLPSIMALSEGDCDQATVKLCASKTLTTQTRYLPFSGTVRTDKLPLMPSLAAVDVRHRLGSYDETVDRNGHRVRLCNWVRFVRHQPRLDDQANVIASRNRGSVLFEVIKDIPEGDELVVFLLPDSAPEDPFSLSALAILRSSIYRRTFDSIMSEAPLDLSRSLIASESPSTIGRNIRKINEIDPSDEESRSPKRPRIQTPSLLPNVLLPSYFPFSFPPHPFMPSSTFSIPQVHSDITKDSPSFHGLPKRASPVRINTHKRRERTMLPCSECGKAFDRPSLLKRHMRTHTGEKPHVCDVCGKGFSTSSSLNTHRRIHSGEKPHQCGVCGKRFTASSNLYYHKMTHIKEKPHKCTLCTRSFPTPGDLRSHMFVHNGQWPHKCSVCGKGFSKLTNLRNHTLLHSGDRHQKRSPESETLITSSPRGTHSPSPSSSFASSSFFHSSPNRRESTSPNSNPPSSPPSEERSYDSINPQSTLTRHSISSLLIKTSSENSPRGTPSPSAGGSSATDSLSVTKSLSISSRDVISPSIPVSLSFPLQLQLSSRLAAISSSFPFPISSNFPSSVVPSILPLLSHGIPFANIPSPPLSPELSSCNESGEDRENSPNLEKQRYSPRKSYFPSVSPDSPIASTSGNNDCFNQSTSDSETITLEAGESSKVLQDSLTSCNSSNRSIANGAL